MKTTNLRELEEQGYTIVDNLIETAFLDAIKESVTAIFQKQIQYLPNICEIEIRAPKSEFADRAQEIHIKIIHALIHYIEDNL